MIKNHIQSEILKNIGKAPTPGQVALSVKLADFIAGSEEDAVFLLKGYAVQEKLPC